MRNIFGYLPSFFFDLRLMYKIHYQFIYRNRIIVGINENDHNNMYCIIRGWSNNRVLTKNMIRIIYYWNNFLSLKCIKIMLF